MNVIVKTIGLFLLLTASYQPAQSQIRPTPKTQDIQTSRATLVSEHFLIRDDPQRISAKQAGEARDEAERAYAICKKTLEPLKVALEEPAEKIDLDLNWDTLVWWGIHPTTKPLRIKVRWADLEYLGQTPRHVLTHEVAHVFSRPILNGGGLSEGIAEYVAMPYMRVPFKQSAVATMMRNGFWIPADSLFLTGDYKPQREKKVGVF